MRSEAECMCVCVYVYVCICVYVYVCNVPVYCVNEEGHGEEEGRKGLLVYSDKDAARECISF